MTDRRSKTSRANLGDHIPQALDPAGTVVVAARLTHDTVALLDEQASAIGITRSQLVRRIIDEHIGQPRNGCTQHRQNTRH